MGGVEGLVWVSHGTWEVVGGLGRTGTMGAAVVVARGLHVGHGRSLACWFLGDLLAVEKALMLSCMVALGLGERGDDQEHGIVDTLRRRYWQAHHIHLAGRVMVDCP